MKTLAFLLLLTGIAVADPAKKPCDPFATVHCDDKAPAAAPVAKRAFVKQPVSGVGAKAAEKCDPFATPHGCRDLVAQADPAPAGSAAAQAPVPPPAADKPALPPADPAKPTAADLRKICVDAMNGDAAFAQSIVATADKQIDQKTIDAHKDAYAHIQKNEKHVILAYAAMWVIAALLVGFLFLRQQGLKAEIAALRRDLKAAEDKA